MENINKIIKEAVFIAIEEYNKSMTIKEKKKVLHNTKLLLENYNELKNHAHDSVYKHIDNKDIDEVNDIESNYSDDIIYIESIKNSKIRTLIMIDHIEWALGRLKIKQERNGTLEKYIALEKYFIEELDYDKTAEELNCGVITARRWVKEMIKELSILLFGVDALKSAMIKA